MEYLQPSKRSSFALTMNMAKMQTYYFSFHLIFPIDRFKGQGQINRLSVIIDLWNQDLKENEMSQKLDKDSEVLFLLNSK